MSAWIYVDGFNLYYGALKGRPYRWLDLKALSTRILPPSKVVGRIKYFTARVSGAGDPNAPFRQQAYLNALATIPEVEVFFGSFLAKTIWRPLENLPAANRDIGATVPPMNLAAGTYVVRGTPNQRMIVGSYPAGPNNKKKKKKPPQPLHDAIIVETHTKEEKGSDVNLAAHLLNDAWLNNFTEAVVISNDTDLVTPIEMVARQRGFPVTVVNPQENCSAAIGLVNVATHVRHLNRTILAASQFPDPIVKPNGKRLSKPATW